MANILNCDIMVSEFKLQLCYCVHVWTNTLCKGINPQLGLNSTLVFREMVNFSNTINYLATQMNNETSFKQHKKERLIIVAGVKE